MGDRSRSYEPVWQQRSDGVHQRYRRSVGADRVPDSGLRDISDGVVRMMSVDDSEGRSEKRSVVASARLVGRLTKLTPWTGWEQNESGKWETVEADEFGWKFAVSVLPKGRYQGRLSAHDTIEWYVWTPDGERHANCGTDIRLFAHFFDCVSHDPRSRKGRSAWKKAMREPGPHKTALLFRPNCPGEYLEQAVVEGCENPKSPAAETYAVAALKNLGCSADLVGYAFCHGTPAIRHQAAAHPACPEPDLIASLGTKDAALLESIAKNVGVTERLREDAAERLRVLVADNDTL